MTEINHTVLLQILKILKKYKLTFVYFKDLDVYIAATAVTYPYEDVPYIEVLGYYITNEIQHFDATMMFRKMEKLFEEDERQCKMKVPSHVNWYILEL